VVVWPPPRAACHPFYEPAGSIRTRSAEISSRISVRRGTAPLVMSRWLVEAASVAGIHRVRVKAEEAGELFDDDVEDQLAQLAVAV
jgi:hypothetical protein